MTPYQRGNRDGLLGLAVELERLAEDERRAGDRYGYREPGTSAREAQSHHWARAVSLSSAAHMARRRAEAMPEDPCEEGGAAAYLERP